MWCDDVYSAVVLKLFDMITHLQLSEEDVSQHWHMFSPKNTFLLSGITFM